ncbi:ABC transporter permease [Pararobbsia silviterrae]|uniref:ABC transporter permease n=1 Tax=Pararobbsia silviterrae TaxID=1792498 RepID=A0A494XRN3_9BURK|nr:ABC transporter permease [Pararobbsia silviterrae]RKP53265.1 ABC transporter permease [Pararobbsia silviterrae]
MRRFERVPPALWIGVALFVICWIEVPRFGSASNLANVSRVASILLLAALGQTVVIIVRGIDFSIGSAVALFSVISVMTAPHYGMACAFAIATLAVLAVGLVNGVFVGVLQAPPFLVTLGSMIAVHGLCGAMVGGVPLDSPADIDFSGLVQASCLGLPVPLWMAVGGFATIGIALRFTRFGRECFALGSNDTAARLAGIPVRYRVVSAYLLNALLVAAAGAILTSRLGSGQPNLYPGMPFEAIAACAIGGVPLSGGKGGAIHALIGVLILTIVVNALVLLNLPTLVQNMLLGVVIVGAVLGRQRQMDGRRVGVAAIG